MLLAISFTSCKTQSPSNKESKYLRHVGDIKHDPILDGIFEVCNEVLAVQYYAFGQNLPYEGDKYEIEKAFNGKYKTPENSNESGLVRIRFMVNCKGESGRFRMMAMDENYNEKIFDNKIADQLMEITKGLKGWRQMNGKNGKPRDYYVYLVFKIRDGEVVQIMP